MIKNVLNFLALGAALLLSAQALAQRVPSAPTNLCIQNAAGTNCATTAVARAKKWNPGHYVRANAVSFVDSDYARQSAYNLTKNNPLFKGGLITVPWGSVEKSEGVYDFSQIDKDLAFVKSIGKKLIIEVWWQKYGGSLPDDRYFPRYIYDAGGVASINSDYTVKMNETRWADRYIALNKALAARYDSDPAIEQIIITETASTSVYEFKRIVPAVAKLWTQTSVVLYMNWVDTGQLAQELMAICAQNGVGIGGPDILPPKPISPVGEDHASRVVRGAGTSSFYSDGSNMQSFGTIDYRGQVPVSYSYEALHGIPPASLVEYAVNTLKVTHLVWAVTEEMSAPMNFSTGVLPTVTQVAGKVATAYPTRFATAVAQN